MIQVRSETPIDISAIEAVTIAAFASAEHSGGTEQFIVNALRRRGLQCQIVSDPIAPPYTRGNPPRSDNIVHMDTTDWLLESDPAIRWQAMRDLTEASPAAVAAERAKIPREGVGAQILACQGTDGAWHRTGEPDWLPTTYTVLFLRSTGIDREDPAVDLAMDRLAAGFRWHESLGGKTFFEGETEPCLNGGTLATGAYFARASNSLMSRLVSEQLEDGGWNCDAPKSTRSSFHSTICVLEGLLEYEREVGATPETTAARKRGEDYLLTRFLFRRKSNGEVVKPEFLSFAFPPRYCYDVLRALDYLRSSGAKPDARVDEAVTVIRNKQQSDGRWLLDDTHYESLGFPFSEKIGEPSKWNTLRALRVLRWYERDRLR